MRRKLDASRQLKGDPNIDRTEIGTQTSPDGSASHMTLYTECSASHDVSWSHPGQARVEDVTNLENSDEGNKIGGQSPTIDSKRILRKFTSRRENFQQSFNPNRLQPSKQSFPHSSVDSQTFQLDSQDDTTLANRIDFILSGNKTLNDIALAARINAILAGNSGARSTTSGEVILDSSSAKGVEHSLFFDQQSPNEFGSCQGDSDAMFPPVSTTQTEFDLSASRFSQTSVLDEKIEISGQSSAKKNSARVLTELLQSQHDISKALGELTLGMAKLADERELEIDLKPTFLQRLKKKNRMKRIPLAACHGEDISEASSATKDDGSLLSFRKLKKNYLFRVKRGDKFSAASNASTKYASDSSLVVGELSDSFSSLDCSDLGQLGKNHVAQLIDSLVLRQEELAVQIVLIAADAMRNAEDKEMEIQRLKHTLRQLESYVASKRTSAKRRLSMNSLSTFGSNTKVWPKIDGIVEENSFSGCRANLPPGMPRVIDISHTVVDIEKICGYDEDDTASCIPENTSFRLLM
ncbi:hypothetical protein FisN_20Lh260 [Fistulifera solaris]|uniref:Uncharacterized protein n=1 Tax=Fistulifera solaris TaxID=1519565 RepID=A0A1Z5KRJ2_FISSO|nr:hypothetical protein FisN_20Lh260 [Fistulifera solaris]|eukprot:GAX28940.1 hypothetical protein FisN_20Lh260 [Fistulifera solaris]